jgi:hypothetical protein
MAAPDVIAASSCAGASATAQACNPTPNGSPAAAAIRHSDSIHCGVVFAPTPIIPSAPARDTAAASCPPATPAIGALTTGTRRPNRVVSQVDIFTHP